MLGSIDCMHWEWKNCPVLWQGQYGANNDINVLDNSSLFDDLLDDKALVAPYVVNDVVFEKGYNLADGIYPQWATFVKSFTVSNDAKHAYFKKRQESARKDVERAFGVLQGRWGIIQQPARQYHVNTIRRIMYSCIIMHNMVLKDQKMAVFDWNDVYANPSRNMQPTWIEREYDDGLDLIDYDFATHGFVRTAFGTLNLIAGSLLWSFRCCNILVVKKMLEVKACDHVVGVICLQEAGGKVLGGTARRKKLLSPKSMDVRPMMEVVKGAAFGILQATMGTRMVKK
ncbi:ALP1-like protein isoform X1 [Tanacetum coccineum]